MRLCVFGTGYVGLVTSVCFADRGHTVIGIDKDKEIVGRLSAGVPTIYEPGLQELLKANLATGRLRFTTQAEAAVPDAEIVFVCVGTPPRPDGSTDMSQVEEVSRTIAPLLDRYKLIVEKSTVPVNTVFYIRRTLRRFAKQGCTYDVASNPEFLREGSAVRDFLHPDRLVIGVESDRGQTLMRELYSRDFDGPIIFTDVRTAELIKHAANAFLASKISFINMIAELCEEVGVDVATVARGIGLDRRIGEAFLHAGLGYGGSCLPKDVRSFIRVAEEHHVDFSLLREVERINERAVARLLRKVERSLWVVRDKTIGVLGVAFKPNTDDIREAPSLKVIPRLLEAGATLRVYDPRAAANLARLYPPDGSLVYVDSPYEAADGAHALIILTDWDVFRTLNLERLRRLMRMLIIVDGRNLFDPREMATRGFEYYSMGRGDVAPVVPAPAEVGRDA